MITLSNIYHVLEATVPLYVAMILAYLSIKWWRLFTPEQCSGINKFVSKFSIPLLSFHVISTNNPYEMNLKLVCADIIQKVLALLVSAVLSRVFSRGILDWLITGFSLSTLPNTVVIGIPLLKGMYGAEAAKFLSQIIVLQSILWYTLLLFLFEFRAAKSIASSPTAELGEEVPEEVQTKHEVETRDSSARNGKIHTILLTMGRKLIINPNTNSSLAGLIWALISFRWEIEPPPLISNSITILSDGGLGMAMFSIGLFTALQPNIIACGIRLMALSIGVRFIIGPALMAIPSYVIGMKGTLLNVAIVQAALPQGIVPFVFAKEYGVHPEILSTSIIIGMIVALPVALVYNLILGLH